MTYLWRLFVFEPPSLERFIDLKIRVQFWSEDVHIFESYCPFHVYCNKTNLVRMKNGRGEKGHGNFEKFLPPWIISLTSSSGRGAPVRGLPSPPRQPGYCHEDKCALNIKFIFKDETSGYVTTSIIHAVKRMRISIAYSQKTLPCIDMYIPTYIYSLFSGISPWQYISLSSNSMSLSKSLTKLITYL